VMLKIGISRRPERACATEVKETSLPKTRQDGWEGEVEVSGGASTTVLITTSWRLGDLPHCFCLRALTTARVLHVGILNSHGRRGWARAALATPLGMWFFDPVTATHVRLKSDLPSDEAIRVDYIRRQGRDQPGGMST
jgi:hypothetical protein